MKRTALQIMLTRLCVAFAALALFLVLMGQSLRVSYPAHERYSDLISQQIENNVSINQYVLEARYNFFTSYDPLVTSLQNQAILQRDLSLPPAYLDTQGRKTLQQQLAENQALLVEQATLIEQFKSKNAVLKNSLTYLAKLTESLDQKTLSANDSALPDLINDILQYSLTADAGLLPGVRNKINQLRSSSSALTQAFVAHAQVIAETKPDVERLTQDILKMTLPKTLHHLDSLYRKQFQRAQLRAGFFRQLAYGWLLLVGIGLASWIIQKQFEAKQRTLEILESIQDAFIALNQAWTITYANPQTATILQQSPQALIGQSFLEAFPEALGLHQIALYQQAAADRILQSFEARLPETDRWYTVRVYPGKHGLSIFLEDVTVRVQSEQQLRQAHAELEQRVEERTVDLQQANQALQIEVAERESAQSEILFAQQVVREVSETRDLSSALQTVLKLTCRQAGWKIGLAWIPGFEQQSLDCVAIWDQSQNLTSAMAQRLTASCDSSAGLLGRVWQNQTPEWIADAAQQPEFEGLLSAEQSLVTAGVGIPIIDNQQVIAVLIFLMEQPEHQPCDVTRVIGTALQIGSLIRRKKAEGALRSSLATNAALVKALPDWMFRIRLDGTVVNSKAAKHCILPFTSENVLQKNLSELLPSAVAQQLSVAISSAQATEGLEVIEYALTLKDQPYEFEARISPSEADEVIVLIRDITERKQAEADVQKSLEREKELNELKTRFVSMASHEFRTPLATILSSSELLEHYRHKWTEEKNLTHLHRIQTATLHMTELLNDVLLIGTAEAGKLEFNPVTVNLIEFCQELLEEIQVSTPTHKIHFSTDCRSFEILSDQKLLRQIFYNLLSNAIKYSPLQTDIDVVITCCDQSISVSIKDQGIGIPAEDLSKVFTAFDRASNVGTISGTGLGLPIVKKSVELHGGEILLSSQLNQGSKFTVIFPAAVALTS